LALRERNRELKRRLEEAKARTAALEAEHERLKRERQQNPPAKK